MKIKKYIKKQQTRQEAFLLFYNKGISAREIAQRLECSERTVYRWKKGEKKGASPVPHLTKRTYNRERHFHAQIFSRMIELKKELPQRSAANIYTKLQAEFPNEWPSESTIRKYLVAQGFQFKEVHNREGYIKFQRLSANDLWQIDIAGVQTVGHLGRLYLIAILDDCSRFIVAAQYFSDQSGMNVMKVIRDAVMKHGRPNQMVADNGAQFRNVIKEYESRYVNLLTALDIKAIFARPHHPQTKGKLERWFGTVIGTFLIEARLVIKNSPDMTLNEFNTMFQEWLRWYNEKKPHRSLPKKCPPASIYLDPARCISRPLQSAIDWNQWINTLTRRKVTKYNSVSYKGLGIILPAGFMGCEVDLLELDQKIEFYHQDKLIMTYPKKPDEFCPSVHPILRTIAQNGTIQYKKQWISIDYKLAGKKVEIKPSTTGEQLYIYLDRVLIKQIKL